MRITGLILCGLVLAASGAEAASPKRVAARFKKKAFAKFAEGDYDAGIRLMNKAYDARPHPGFLLNIAVAYDRWGDHCPQALKAFDRFFKACDDTCSLADSGRAKYEQVASTCPVPLEVLTIPGGAQVFVDDQLKGLSPLSLELMPGPHEFRVRKDGFETQQTVLALDHPGPGSLNLRLLEKAASTPPPPPLQAPPPPPPQLVVEPKSEDRKSSLTPWAFTAGGVAVAGTAVGAVFTVLTRSSLQAEEDARAVPLTRREIEGHQSDAIQRAWVANIGFGVAIAAAATSAALFLLDDDEDES